MKKRISITTIAQLAAGACLAGDTSPGPLDLDEALARQSAGDLISGAASAYDCNIALYSFRRLGDLRSPLFFVEVQMHGPECDDALLLLARQGSERNLVFRRREPAPDIREIAPDEGATGS